MREFGVDEAGKGPVLGSMFAAAVVADPGALPADVGDSKAVAPERREELAAAIRDVADAVGLAEIPVERIDDEETDMNSLTVAAHAEALDDALDDLDVRGEHPPATDGADGDAVLSGYVDAGDTNAVRFERRVADAASADLDVRGEHAADETYAVVGAASIVAKVERDAHVAALAEEYGDLGSGYPSDPSTREFLEAYVAEHDGLPPCARSSWKTSRDVLAAADQSSLGEFEPDGGRETAEDDGTTSEVRSDGGRPEPQTTLDEF
ncbi:MAG: ribonuclease HII [Haloarculaceae archaeon]